MAGGIALDDDSERAADHVLGLHDIGQRDRHRAGRRPWRAQTDIGKRDGHAATALVHGLVAVDVDLADWRWARSRRRSYLPGRWRRCFLAADQDFTELPCHGRFLIERRRWCSRRRRR